MPTAQVTCFIVLENFDGIYSSLLFDFQKFFIHIYISLFQKIDTHYMKVEENAERIYMRKQLSTTNVVYFVKAVSLLINGLLFQFLF